MCYWCRNRLVQNHFFTESYHFHKITRGRRRPARAAHTAELSEPVAAASALLFALRKTSAGRTDVVSHDLSKSVLVAFITMVVSRMPCGATDFVIPTSSLADSGATNSLCSTHDCRIPADERCIFLVPM